MKLKTDASTKSHPHEIVLKKNNPQKLPHTKLNDSTIFKSSENNDILVLDRGFRDPLDIVESVGVTIKIPTCF